jgi:hypothetical protein
MVKYLALLALASAANAVSLGDIKHVVLLMQENRSFQHVSDCTPPPNKRSTSNRYSILGPWLVFEGLLIPMFRSMPMANPSGISMCDMHLRSFV